MATLPMINPNSGSTSSLRNNNKVDTRVTYGKTTSDEESCCGRCMVVLLSIFSMILVICTFPFSIFFVVNKVQEYERAVIFRFGRVKRGGAVGPGLFFIIPCIDQIQVVDLRTVTFQVKPQEILTKDSVTIHVDAVVFYRIKDPLNSVINVNDAAKSTQFLACTTLRNVLGTKSLSDILQEREHTASIILNQLEEATHPWGIEVERVEVKDVRLPNQLQRAMAAEAEATRQARAKVIEAEGEQKSSKSLKEASDILSASAAGLQLRYLQTLTQISAEKNSTIIFPLPIDIMDGFRKKMEGVVGQTQIHEENNEQTIQQK